MQTEPTCPLCKSRLLEQQRFAGLVSYTCSERHEVLIPQSTLDDYEEENHGYSLITFEYDLQYQGGTYDDKVGSFITLAVPNIRGQFDIFQEQTGISWQHIIRTGTPEPGDEVHVWVQNSPRELVSSKVRLGYTPYDPLGTGLQPHGLRIVSSASIQNRHICTTEAQWAGEIYLFADWWEIVEIDHRASPWGYHVVLTQ